MKIKINDKIVDAKLPKKFKAKWIKALRSGKFTQGKSELRSEYYDDESNVKIQHCCLGVACEIVGYKDIDGKPFITKDEFLSTTKDIPSLLKGSGIKGEKEYNKLVGKLATMNDKGKSFNYIASYIERYL